MTEEEIAYKVIHEGDCYTYIEPTLGGFTKKHMRVMALIRKIWVTKASDRNKVCEQLVKDGLMRTNGIIYRPSKVILDIGKWEPTLKARHLEN